MPGGASSQSPPLVVTALRPFADTTTLVTKPPWPVSTCRGETTPFDWRPRQKQSASLSCYVLDKDQSRQHENQQHLRAGAVCKPPDTGSAVIAGGHGSMAIRCQADGVEAAGVALQQVQALAILQAPHPD